MGYLGTYAPDRDASLRSLFVEPARRQPHQRFLLAGAQYGGEFPVAAKYLLHPASAACRTFGLLLLYSPDPERHQAINGGNRILPSGRLFEATACGAAVLSDSWEGLDQFFEPDSEILLARDTEDAMAALERSPDELARMAARPENERWPSIPPRSGPVSWRAYCGKTAWTGERQLAEAS